MNYKGYKGITPSNETLQKWLFTRKRSEFEFLTFGDFRFPGYFTTQHYKSDHTFFWIAIFCEAGFLATVSIMVGGFDLYLSLAALVCVVLDLIGAYSIHKNEDKISTAQLRFNIEDYKNKILRSTSDNVKIKKEQIIREHQKPSRFLGKILIIISAILKIFGSAVLFELPVFTIVLTIIYCFVAWIHIKKTGFYWSARRFGRAMDAELEKHIQEGGSDKLQNKVSENDFRNVLIENIPSNVELRPIRMGIFENMSIFDEIYHDETSNKWYYRIWKHHMMDDEDLQKFIYSSDKSGDVLSDSAKAFIAADYSERFFLNILDKKK